MARIVMKVRPKHPLAHAAGYQMRFTTGPNVTCYNHANTDS